MSDFTETFLRLYHAGHVRCVCKYFYPKTSKATRSGIFWHFSSCLRRVFTLLHLYLFSRNARRHFCVLFFFCELNSISLQNIRFCAVSTLIIYSQQAGLSTSVLSLYEMDLRLFSCFVWQKIMKETELFCNVDTQNLLSMFTQSSRDSRERRKIENRISSCVNAR